MTPGGFVLRRQVVIASFAAGLLPACGLATIPAAAAGSGHQVRPVQHTGSLTRLPHAAKAFHHAARIDSSLAGASGRVTVMLKLAGRPAAVAYTHPRSTASGHALTRAARISAYRNQQHVLRARQSTVVGRLHASVPRATVLYRLSAGYNGVAVRTDASRLDALSRLPGVRAVVRIAPLHRLNTVTVPLIGAPQAWQGVSGDTGAGMTVGVIDTGFDYTHADFGGPGTKAAYDAALAADTVAPTAGSFDSAKFAGGVDLVGDAYDGLAGRPEDLAGDPDPADAIPHPDPNPLDCQGHGSHVSGSAAGYGVLANGDSAKGTDYSSLAALSADDYQAKFRIGPGVAPGASIFAVKVFGCAEEGDTEVVPQALDYLIDQNLKKTGPHIDVINMSLGGDYASAHDPVAVETNRAVKNAGIEVVSAAGNAGDVYDILGSPGNAVRGLGVAASDDSQDVADGLRINSPASIKGVQPGTESVLFDWASMNAPVTGDLATTGDITKDPDDSNNADGCDPISQDLTGKIAYLSWTDNDALRRCGSLGRTDNARDAGAIGAVFFDDENEFSAGINGDEDIPAILITKNAGDAINTELLAGHAVNVSLDKTLTNATVNKHPETTNGIATFSSRGIGETGILKPDVAAPGQTVFSVNVGTGTEGVSESGTSMATPHAAGVAALVRAAHPTWNAEQVKAAIMNTATQDVFARTTGSAADQQNPETPMRVGAGRVQADKAVAASTLAYADNGTGSVSVSFGRVDATQSVVTRSARVRVVNTLATPVNYTVGYHASTSMPGARYSVSPSTLQLAANGSGLVTVTLTVHRNKLVSRPDQTIALDPVELGLERSFIADASGLLTVTPTGGEALRVPVYAAPRPVSTMHAPDAVQIQHHTAHFRLHGKGVDNSDLAHQPGDALESAKLDAFELQGTSGRRPHCSAKVRTRCVAFGDQRGADLAAVGFASDVPGMLAHGIAKSVAGAVDNKGAFGYFGIATHGNWRTEAGVQEFDVYIDVDGNNGPDAVLYNTRISTTEDTDYLISELDDMAGNPLDQELLNNADGSINTNLFDSNVITLPFMLAALEAVGWDAHKHPPIRYYVDSALFEMSPDFIDTFSFFDSIGDPFAGQRILSVDPTRPAYSVSGKSHACSDIGACSVLLNDKPGKRLKVTEKAGRLATDRPLGLLLFHHDNALGSREEVVALGKVGKPVHHH
jgi:subtilisin family serine protease